MRLRALSKWLVVPAMGILALAAGVGLYGVKSRQPLDAPRVGPTSAGLGAPASPDSMTVVSRPSDASAREVVEANGVGPLHPRPNDEGMAAQVALEAAQPPATATPLAIGFAIRGNVVSKDGPIRDEPGQWPQMLSVGITAPDLSRRCEIDEQGRFECARLDAGSYVVSVADGMAPHRLICRPVEVRLDAQTPSRDVTFILGDEVPVVVMVLRDESSEPVSRCWVTAELADGPGSVGAQTDHQGCCILNLIPGRYRIYANRDESGARVVNVLPSARSLAVDLRVAAPKKRMIRGLLVDSQGNRIKGYVDLGLAVREPNSEPADSFSIPEPGYQPPDGFTGYAYNPSGELARQFILQQDAPDDELVVVLEPRARIVGRVVGVDGRPITDAQVDLETTLADGRWRTGDDSLYALAMDGTGGFELEGLAVGLKVRVAAYRGQSGLQGRSGVLDLKPGETCNAGEIVLSPPKVLTGILRGRITDEQGEPIVNRNVQIWTNPGSSLGTDHEGYFTVRGLPTDEPVLVVVVVPGYGKWSQMATTGDLDCNFQVYPSGRGVVDGEAPPLVVDRWLNHAPVTLEDLRGRVVVLMFCSLREHPRPADAALSSIRVLDRQYRSQGLMTIVVYNHLSGDDPPATNITEYLLGQFGGLPIAGCFDAEPNSVTDPMPKDCPTAAMNGVTHWRYRVCSQPTCFLIDKQGKVRYCVEPKDLWDPVGSLLAE